MDSARTDPFSDLSVLEFSTREELDRAYEFFQAEGHDQRERIDYRCHTETIIGVEREGVILGAVRMSSEFGHFVLRTMVVAAHVRGQGLGRYLNQVFVDRLGDDDCVCLAFGDVIDFYIRFQFEEIEDSVAPPHLIRRRDLYAAGMGPAALAARGGLKVLRRAGGSTNPHPSPTLEADSSGAPT